jgi:hypothetical protein
MNENARVRCFVGENGNELPRVSQVIFNLSKHTYVLSDLDNFTGKRPAKQAIPGGIA